MYLEKASALVSRHLPAKAIDPVLIALVLEVLVIWMRANCYENPDEAYTYLTRKRRRIGDFIRRKRIEDTIQRVAPTYIGEFDLQAINSAIVAALPELDVQLMRDMYSEVKADA